MPRPALGTRRVCELPPLGGDEECGLLGDIDRVIGNPFHASGDQHMPQRQLALLWRVLERERGLEDVTVEVVDLVVLDVDPLRQRQVTGSERGDGMQQL